MPPAAIQHGDDWIRAAAATGLASASHLRTLGIGRAAADALAAPLRHVAQVVHLLVERTEHLTNKTPTRFTTHAYGADITAVQRGGIRGLHPAPDEPRDRPQHETLLAGLLATD